MEPSILRQGMLEHHTGLFCPKCLSSVLMVEQTLAGMASVIRRRKCPNGHHFVTEERTCDKGIYNLAQTRKRTKQEAA